MRAGVHQLHCTNVEEVDTGNHLDVHVAYQKVGNVLQKNEL